MATAGKNLSHFNRDDIPDAQKLKIGLVVSGWNAEITEALYEGAYETLLECGAQKENLIRLNVPGSFELIFGCKKLISDKSPDAVIAIGSVIRGETKHFDFVCDAAAQGIKDLNLLTGIPVIFCVLTDDNWQQAKDRSGGKHGNKGTEAAIAAIRMASL
ncbi:MAG: 6,7-dimethyl-8-ribityllumazine synthase [Flavobacteriaceae bacterium]